MTDSKQRLGWLQALRGVAAIGVVISHCVVFLAPDAPHQWLIGALNHLGSGIDLFFVISGFIMVHTTIDDPGGFRSAVRFAAKRLQRIWPAYVVLTLVIGSVGLGWSLIGDEATRLRLVKSIIFLPASYDTLFADQIIPQGWTLSFEIYFYAVFAVSLMFARWRWVFLALWCGVMLVAVPLAYGASLTGVYESFATPYRFDYLKIATNPFVWEFAGGGLAGAIYHSRLRIGNARIGRAAVSVAIPFAAWNTFDPILPGSFGLAAGYAVMIATIALASKTAEMAAPRALRYLGDVSYTLYLEHMAVIHVLHQVYQSIGLTDLSATWSIVPLTLVACIAAAALTGRFLEHDMLTRLLSVCHADGWGVFRAAKVKPAG